jgi:transposase-like protein
MRRTPSLDSDLIANRWDADVARRLLAAWRRRGQTMAAFARKHGLNVQRLIWWRKRLGGDGDGDAADAPEPVAFIPAVMPPPSPEVSGRVLVWLAGCVEVEGETSTMPAAWVAELAQELGRVAAWSHSTQSWDRFWLGNAEFHHLGRTITDPLLVINQANP